MLREAKAIEDQLLGFGAVAVLVVKRHAALALQEAKVRVAACRDPAAKMSWGA